MRVRLRAERPVKLAHRALPQQRNLREEATHFEISAASQISSISLTEFGRGTGRQPTQPGWWNRRVGAGAIARLPLRKQVPSAAPGARNHTVRSPGCAGSRLPGEGRDPCVAWAPAFAGVAETLISAFGLLLPSESSEWIWTLAVFAVFCSETSAKLIIDKSAI
jgi:hypothetical protein